MITKPEYDNALHIVNEFRRQAQRQEQNFIKWLEHCVCDIFDADITEIRTGDRRRENVQARRVMIYILVTYYGNTYHNAASRYNRDHTTALDTIRKITDVIETPNSDMAFYKKIQKCIRLLEVEKEQIVDN